MKRRLVSFMLVIVMLVTMLPVTAFADDGSINSYDDLKAAVEAGNDVDLVLGGNVGNQQVDTMYIQNGQTVKLDLNGYTLTGPHNYNNGKQNLYAFIIQNGTLILDDTSAEQSGQIYCMINGIETKGGTFIMNGGKVVAVEHNDDSGAIVNYGGTVEINDGEVIANCLAVDAEAWFTNSAKVTINGGKLSLSDEPLSDAAVVQVGGTFNKYSAIVEIKDGVFSGEAIIVEGTSTYDSSSTKAEVSGGTFKDKEGNKVDVSDYLAPGLALTPNGTVAAPLNYVSLGDSMTNGYGLGGYNGNTGVEDYGTQSYANQFATAIGATHHAQLAMSAMRAEDLHWLLEVDYDDPAVVSAINEMDTNNDWDEDLWYSVFTNGDYWTWKELVHDYRLDVAAYCIEGKDTTDGGAFNNNYRVAYSDYTDAAALAIVAEYYQESVKNADVISLGMGNGNFGVFAFGRIMEAIGFGEGEPADAMIYNVENALRECDPALKAQMMTLKAEAEAVLASKGFVVNDNDPDTTSAMEALYNTALYSVISYALNYAGSVEAILQLNPDADIIQVALMNTIKTNTPIEGQVTLGDLMDALFIPLNAYIAALPTAMQAAQNSVYADATFYYAEAPYVECIVDTYEEGALNGTVRQRFFWSIVEDEDGDPGMVWGLLNGDPETAEDDMVVSVTLAEIEDYEDMDDAQKVAYAAADSDKAMSISMYLAFEKAIVAGKNTPVSIDSIMGLGSIMTGNPFGAIMSDFYAAAGDAIGTEQQAAVFAGLAAFANSTALAQGFTSTITADNIMAVYVAEDDAKLTAAKTFAQTIADAEANAPVIEALAKVGVAEQAWKTQNASDTETYPTEDALNAGWDAIKDNATAIEAILSAEVAEGSGTTVWEYGKDTAIEQAKATVVDIFAPALVAAANNVETLCVLLVTPDVLGDVVADSELSGLLALFARCVIGNGIGSHPSENGHTALFEAVKTAYGEGYTSKDETIENAQIALDEIAKLLEQYGPEILAGAYSYAEQQGYIAQLETAVNTLKTELEVMVKEYTENTKVAFETKIAELESQLAALEAELKALNEELMAKKAELEAQVGQAAADVDAALKQAIADLEAMIAEIEAAIEAVEATIGDVTEMIKTLKAKLDAMGEELADLSAGIVVLEDALKALADLMKNPGDALEAAVAAYEKAREAALAAIDVVEGIYKQVKTVAKEISTIAADVQTAVEGAYYFVAGALKAAYDALPEDVGAEIKAQIAELQAELAAKKAAIDAAVKAEAEKLWAAVEGEIAKLEAEIAAKEEKLANAIGEAKAELAAQIAAQIGALEAQLAELEAKLEALNADLEAAVNAEIAKIEAQIAALQAELEAKYAELETAVGAAKAEIEAQIAELEAQIAALQAELEAKVNATKAAIEAQIAVIKAELEAKYAELEAAVGEAKAKLAAQLVELQTELAIKKAEVEAAVKAYADQLWAAAEVEIAKLEAQIAALQAELEAKVNEEIAKLEAQIDILEAKVIAEIKRVDAAVKTVVQGVFTAAVKQIQTVVDFTNKKINEVVTAVETAYTSAISATYAVASDSYYVALGDGTAVSDSYVDLLAATLDVAYENLAVDGQTIGDAAAYIVENAADISKADLITLGYGNHDFAKNAVVRAWDALMGKDIETYDWVTLVGAEGAAYVEQALADIKAELVEGGMDVVVSNDFIETKTDMATAVTLAVEAYAYASVEYMAALPTVVGTIRAINPDAVVAIVGMYNPLDEVTLAFGETTIEVGEYLDYLVKGVDVYGTGFCFLSHDAIYVSAPDAQTDAAAREYKLLNFLLDHKDYSEDMYPNADGHEYISAQILNALTVVEAYVVSFDSTEGTGEMQALRAIAGEAFTLPECTFTAPQYMQFKGWAIGDELVMAGEEYVFTEDTTVYAVWEPVTYKVTFHGVGAIGTMEPKYTNAFEELELPENGFITPEGAEFLCWAIGAPDGEKVLPGVSYTFTEDTDVYAVWVYAGTEIPVTLYTVTFDLNGYGDNFKQIVIDGGLVIEPATPVAECCAFLGWYTTATCDDGTQWHFTEDTVTEDITLYAKWKAFPDEFEDGDLWFEDIPEQTYTGKAIKPTVKVYSGKTLLVAGKDYTISYKNNINAAEDDAVNAKGKSIAPTITIKGKGNYSGTVTKTFTISPVDLNSDAITADEALFAAENAKGQKPKVTVSFGTKKLSTKDVTITYVDANGETVTSCKGSGTWTIVLVGKGNFIGERTVTFTAVAKDTLMSKATITLGTKTFVYDGNEKMPSVTVKVGKNTLTDGYSIEYKNNTAVGTATVIVTGDGENYFGTKTATFKITGVAMSKVKTDKVAAQTYTGKAIEPECKLYDANGAELDAKAYTVSYSKNVNKGTGTIVFTGNPEFGYSGTKKVTFKINALDVKNAEVDANVDVAPYMKGGAKPVPAVTVNGTELVAGKDYTVSYKNNTKVAAADEAKAPTITVKFKGNYVGTVTDTFTISAKPLADTKVVAADVAYSDTKMKAPTLTITDVDGKKLAVGKDYEKTVSYRYNGVEYSNFNEIVYDTDYPVGEEVTVIVTGKGNYTGTAEATFVLMKTNISKATFKITSQTYTGSEITLDKDDFTTAKVGKDNLTMGEDYEIVSYSKNVDKGTASVVIQGMGNYGGTKTVTFKITTKALSLWNWLF